MKRADSPARVRLDRKFFNRPTLIVARELLGKFIVHRNGASRVQGMITETEAYKGPKDRAAHSFGGRRTPRVEAMYQEGGTVYVFFVYGMHWQLNFSTVGKGIPQAVLIRGLIADTAEGRRVIDGPGRVTKYLETGKSVYGEDVTTSNNIWLEDRGVKILPRHIIKSPRVGIDYAGSYWAARLWRFRIDPLATRDR